MYNNISELEEKKEVMVITEKLNDIDIVEGDINSLNRLYKNFERDFSENERKELKHLEMLMLKNKYKLILAKHKELDIIIGYALVYTNDKNKMLWLDYIAIEEMYRNSGYGTLFFNKIIETVTENLTGIFIEIEIPSKEDKQSFKQQERRIKFYERLGAKRLKFNYVLPTNEGGSPLYLYFKPIGNLAVLPKDQIKETISSVFNYIHTDIKDKDNIFKSFVGEIEDVYFD